MTDSSAELDMDSACNSASKSDLIPHPNYWDFKSTMQTCHFFDPDFGSDSQGTEMGLSRD